MIIQKDIEKTNKEALEKVCLAQPILNKIISNPSLVEAHDPILSALGDSRHNKYLIMDTVTEIREMYRTEHPDSVPKQVQIFVKDANRFLYGSLN